MQLLGLLSAVLLVWGSRSAFGSSSADASGDEAATQDDPFAFDGAVLRPADDVSGTRFTGRAATLPLSEQETIIRIARAEGVDPVALAAIRLAENGGPGRQFGVVSEPAPTYEDQATIAARSIKANLQRAGAGSITADFWSVMGARWAPLRAANDPTGLNANWVRNVTTFYEGSALA